MASTAFGSMSTKTGSVAVAGPVARVLPAAPFAGPEPEPASVLAMPSVAVAGPPEVVARVLLAAPFAGPEPGPVSMAAPPPSLPHLDSRFRGILYLVWSIPSSWPSPSVHG